MELKKGQNMTNPNDTLDAAILKYLQDDCRITLENLAKKLHIPKSTLHYRIKRLEKTAIIEGYHAKLNATKLGYDYLAVVLVTAKYGPRYHERIGKRIAAINGVWGVYYVLGEYDFVVLIRAKNREDYMNKLERLSNMPDIERTITQVTAKIFKEDPRVAI